LKAEELKNLREKYELTKVGLAKKLGVTRGTIHNWEEGGVIPEPKILQLKNFFNSFDGNIGDISGVKKLSFSKDGVEISLVSCL